MLCKCNVLYFSISQGSPPQEVSSPRPQISGLRSAGNEHTSNDDFDERSRDVIKRIFARTDDNDVIKRTRRRPPPVRPVQRSSALRRDLLQNWNVGGSTR